RPRKPSTIAAQPAMSIPSAVRLRMRFQRGPSGCLVFFLPPVGGLPPPEKAGVPDAAAGLVPEPGLTDAGLLAGVGRVERRTGWEPGLGVPAERVETRCGCFRWSVT